MKLFYPFTVLFILFVSVFSIQSQNNQWIHSYIRLDTHWDPTQERLRFLVCADSLIQSSDVTASLQINGNSMSLSSIKGGVVSVMNPGDTVRIVFTATHIPTSNVYAFDAQVVTHVTTPSIQYLVSPANNQALPMSILTTKKNASSSSPGKVRLNISGGLPFGNPNDLYAIRWKLNNVPIAGNFTDSLLNLQGGSSVNANFRDSWFHCPVSGGGVSCCDTVNGVWVCDTLCFPACSDLFFCYDGMIDLLLCNATVAYSSGAVEYQALANFQGVSHGTIESDGAIWGITGGLEHFLMIPSVCMSNYLNAIFYHYDGTDVFCSDYLSAWGNVQPQCVPTFTCMLDSSGNYTLNINDIDNGTYYVGHPAAVLNKQLSQTHFTCADTGMQQVILSMSADCDGYILDAKSCTTMVDVQPSAACANSATSIVTLSSILPKSWTEGTSPLIVIPFQAEGNYYSDNIFVAEISDSNGNFSNPVVLGTKASSQSGVWEITGVVPHYLPAGKNYRIRVNGNSPVTIGSEVDKIVIHKLTGVEGDLANNGVTIFPNPASLYFHLSIPKNIEVASVALIDVSGRVMRNYSSNQDAFSLEGIGNGLYFVQVRVKDTYQYVKIVVE